MTRLDEAAPGLFIAQPSRGFRYGVEAFWLAGFALELLECRGLEVRGAQALDLGTGSGVIAGLLAARGMCATGVDLRPEWEPLWAESLAASELAGRLSLERGDLTEVSCRALLVCSNPPFFPKGTGPVAKDPWRAAARTESTATLRDVVEAVQRCLLPGGLGCLVVPVERAVEVERVAEELGLILVSSAQIGGRRWLGALSDRGPVRPHRQLAQDHAAVQGWVARARGRVVPGPT